ncbi:MAG: hypothetical protein IKD43_01830 [Clostridia bacterium]|nr:hypothetical protein [Clostridia bacterium]
MLIPHAASRDGERVQEFGFNIRWSIMKNLFESWKYILKNVWFVLPFAVMPAVFLALSLDYSAISTLIIGFFTGNPRLDFMGYFNAWSLFRFDSWLGGIFSLIAFLFIAIFAALMLTFVEKHLRIGKRSFSGVFAGFCNVLPASILITFVYAALYEVWALLVSALLFTISAIEATPAVYIFSITVVLIFTFALLYVATAFYLWLPCRQMTGFGFYDAFLYSYRLMIGVRWRLVLSFTISYMGGIFLLICASLLPGYAFRIASVIIFAALFLSFCIRMETIYFETDKLDREDILHSYKEY